MADGYGTRRLPPLRRRRDDSGQSAGQPQRLEERHRFNSRYENWQPGGKRRRSRRLRTWRRISWLPLKRRPVRHGLHAGPVGGRRERVGAREFSRSRRTCASAFRRRSSCRRSTSASGSSTGAPGKIHYTSTTRHDGTVKQSASRAAPSWRSAASLDRQIYDRFGVYVEAAYVYGYTSYGGGFGTPDEHLQRMACDPLKNTTVATMRGGLRVADRSLTRRLGMHTELGRERHGVVVRRRRHRGRRVRSSEEQFPSRLGAARARGRDHGGRARATTCG